MCFLQLPSHILIFRDPDSFPGLTETIWLAWDSCPYLLCYISTRLSFWWSPLRLVVTRAVEPDNKEGDNWGQPCLCGVRVLAAKKWWSKSTSSVTLWMVNFFIFVFLLFFFLSLRVKDSTCSYSQGALSGLWSASLLTALYNQFKAN